MAFNEEKQFCNREETDDSHKEIYAIIKVQIPTRQTRQTGRRIHPNHRNAKPDTGGNCADLAWLLEAIPPRVQKAKRYSAKYSAGPNRNATRANTGRQKDQTDGGQKRPYERRDARQHQRIPRLTAFLPLG